jgi:hypothetical protein
LLLKSQVQDPTRALGNTENNQTLLSSSAVFTKHHTSLHQMKLTAAEEISLDFDKAWRIMDS